MNEAGHIIPAPEVEPDEIVAQVKDELFHLVSERMRLHQGHRLNRARLPLHAFDQCVENVAPPERFLGRLRFWNVDAERALHPEGADAESQQRQIEERSARCNVRDHTGLREMQTANAAPDHRIARRDRDGSPALGILIGQLAG